MRLGSTLTERFERLFSPFPLYTNKGIGTLRTVCLHGRRFAQCWVVQVLSRMEEEDVWLTVLVVEPDVQQGKAPDGLESSGPTCNQRFDWLVSRDAGMPQHQQWFKYIGKQQRV